MHQRHSEGHSVYPSRGFRQELVVADQAAESRRRGEAPFHHPPARQRHNAALCHGQLDDLKRGAVRFSISSRLVSGVAPVHEGHYDRAPGRLLDLCGLFSDLRASAFVFKGDHRHQQLTQKGVSER